MSNTPTYMEIATLVLGSSVMSGLISAAITGVRDSAGSRRDGYSNAIKALVARVEFPYRVRRRTSDDPKTLSELAKLGHDIQEDLASARIWVHTESARLARIFEKAVSDVDAVVGPATSDAWMQKPISDPAHMNLSGWGAGSQDQSIKNFGRAVEWRFGWRRVLALLPGVPHFVEFRLENARPTRDLAPPSSHAVGTERRVALTSRSGD